ncbi:MAG TPA: helix-turn-helix domain-containing protein [Candidatus Eisenbergiella merdavium]|uniref:Helix-turn-helix domain-containing protein n=1 Tax=Candidatus Eisenbergiella merdavium TaxID=2838551 RepID=A0A9D2SNL8_9FIRM|nr:helix-turn-helix domain-containing protein [Candidatus Eisenbergiella merdavium]
MFANRIKYLRQSRELSQVQLAQRLGVVKQSVSNWENDNIMPSVEMLKKIADFFEVSTDYLLGRDENKNGGIFLLDVTGLTPLQISHIQFIIDDFRSNR